MNIEELQAACQAGQGVKYLFFWGHQPRIPGQVDQSCFSQWYPAAFEVEGQHYPTAEHFMMAHKARLFGDCTTEQAILKASHPGAAKRLGREVAGFEEERWCAERFEIVCQANLAKFTQNPPLAHYLQQTGNRVLVEASPLDRIWGIGLAADDERASDPFRWEGLNLLGFALMQVRQELTL